MKADIQILLLTKLLTNILKTFLHELGKNSS